jgi:hypothetical protein
MTKKQRFSDQLRRAVQESDKTRYQIHKATGIDQGNLSRFVNEGGWLSMESIDKLCGFLGLRLVACKPHRKAKGK